MGCAGGRAVRRENGLYADFDRLARWTYVVFFGPAAGGAKDKDFGDREGRGSQGLGHLGGRRADAGKPLDGGI